MLFRGVAGPGRGSPPIRPRPSRWELMALAGCRTRSARPMCSPCRLGVQYAQPSCFVRHANGRSDRLTGRGGAAAQTSLRHGRTTTIRAPDRAANPLYSPGLARDERPSLDELTVADRRSGSRPVAGRARRRSGGAWDRAGRGRPATGRPEPLFNARTCKASVAPMHWWPRAGSRGSPVRSAQQSGRRGIPVGQDEELDVSEDNAGPSSITLRPAGGLPSLITSRSAA
jgi:hypothetical protein